MSQAGSIPERRLGGGWLPALAAAAGLALLAGGISLWVVLRLAFPYLPPPPAAAAAQAHAPAPLRRGVHTSLLAALPRAVVEAPSLQHGRDLLQEQYRRGIDLPVPGLRAGLEGLALALPLVLPPESSEELDHELQHCLYLPSPATVSVPLSLPRGARLRFSLAALALPGAAPEPSLHLSVIDGDATLLEKTYAVEPLRLQPQLQVPFRSVELDLSAFAGRSVWLRLRSESAAAASATGPAHLFVGDPLLLAELDAEARRPNLLWINIDTVQAAVTGVGGGGLRSATPELDRLAAQGVSFRWSYASSNWTRPANMAFLTGLYPSELGLKVGMIPTLAEERRSFYLWDFPTLPKHLTRQGYETRAIVQNNLLEDVWGTGVDVGFGTYRYISETFEHSHRITAEAIHYIEQHHDNTWFLYLGYNAPHWPYRPPRSALRDTAFAQQAPWRWLEALYAAEVSFSDSFLRPLALSLERLGIAEDTLVVINSDHGEQLDPAHAQEILRASLWQAGEASHVMTRPGHETLFDETARVPLVLWWPGHLPGGRRVDEPTAAYEIPATVLELMGLPPMADQRGSSLAPVIAGQRRAPTPLLIEGKSVQGVVSWPYKYIRRAPGFEWVRNLARREPLHRVPEELYDLERDPLERSDLVAARPAVVERLRGALAALAPAPRYLYFLEALGPAEPQETTPKEAERHLLALRPAEEIGAIQLLGPEPGDRIWREADAWWVDFAQGPGDRDRVVLRTRRADARVQVEWVPAAAPEGGEDPSGVAPTPLPLRCGELELPLRRFPLELSDASPYSELDADRDPSGGAGPALRVWRIPVVGGIAGRGGQLDDAVQATFRAWGYVK